MANLSESNRPLSIFRPRVIKPESNNGAGNNGKVGADLDSRVGELLQRFSTKDQLHGVFCAEQPEVVRSLGIETNEQKNARVQEAATLRRAREEKANRLRENNDLTLEAKIESLFS